MRFLVFLLALFPLILAGCTTLNQTKHSLPKCNGYSKRVLNKSMWDWQEKASMLVNNFASDEDNPAHEIFTVVTATNAKSYENCE